MRRTMVRAMGQDDRVSFWWAVERALQYVVWCIIVHTMDSGMPKRKGRPPRRSTDPRSVECIEWHLKAVEMRTRGHTYAQISDALKMSQSAVHKAVSTYLRQTREIAVEHAEEIRRIELDRIDRMLASVSPQAESGDIAAIGICLKLQERRSKLLGLDAPASSAVTLQAASDTVQALLALVAS